MNYEEEREIDVLSLLFNVLNKWRIVLLIGLACMLIAGGYKFVKISTTDPADAEVIEKEDVTVDSSIEKITDDDYTIRMAKLEATRKNAENTVKLLQEKADHLKSYNQESILMQVDPYHKPEATATYTFHAADSENLFRDPADEIIYGYTCYLGDEDDYSALAEKYNTDPSYIRELVSYEADEDANSLTLTATGLDHDMAEDILAVLQKELLTAIASDTNHTGTVILASEAISQYAEVRDDKLIKIQKKATETEIQNENDLATKESELLQSETEIKKLDKSKAKYDKAVDKEYERLLSEQQNSGLSFKDKIKGSLKYALIGLIAGILIGGIGYGIAYVINPILRKNDEITDYYGFTLLGSFSKPVKKDPIDRWLQKLEKVVTDQPDTLILNNIALMVSARAPEAKKILLMGTIKKARIDDIASKLRLVLPNVELDTVAELSNATEDLKKVIETQHVIIVEEREYSALNKIDKLAAIISANEKNLIGFITA